MLYIESFGKKNPEGNTLKKNKHTEPYSLSVSNFEKDIKKLIKSYRL